MEATAIYRSCRKQSYLLHADFLTNILFNLEAVGDLILRNTRWLLMHNTAYVYIPQEGKTGYATLYSIVKGEKKLECGKRAGFELLSEARSEQGCLFLAT